MPSPKGLAELAVLNQKQGATLASQFQLRVSVRRIRCSEEKPYCSKCTSTGRQCAYSASGPQRALVSPIPQWHAGQRERRAFEFYFHRAGPALAGILDLTFWNGTVLQMCRLEPAVWDAVISLSTLYQRPPINDETPFSLIHSPAAVRHAYHQEALVWYSRSLAALQQRINQGVVDIAISTITCILFIAIELLQGHKTAAVALYNQGAQLLASGTPSAPSGSGFQSLMAITNPIFRRLGAQFLISTDGELCDSWAVDYTDTNKLFTTINEARNALLGLVAEWKILNKDIKRDLGNLNQAHVPNSSAFVIQQRQLQLEARLRVWHTAFMSMMSPRYTGIYPPAQCSDDSTCLLMMTYISILIETRTSLALNEMIYDEFEADFNQILQYAPSALDATRSSDGSQPDFMFEMGVFLPLFITALKCRHPQLRRRALSFLLDAPPVQGLCMCAPVVNVIATIILIEEDLYDRDRIESLISVLAGPGKQSPAEKRVVTFNVSSYLNNEGIRENRLHLATYASDAEGRYGLSETSVLLPLLSEPAG
ncbi:transcriptional regulator family: Fungal Specific TF [Penicillium brevicompactum]|uniref:transcriptional regulator family: Fungal Specific TF n=1 Tax=Penicillium brevicompactum TaxID=5074 RepID=UPI00254032AF|nr:transcriptional regulator family: Fungal Specific TF [Penicillium brevicompactum]KAJ5332711.1 transcriptional regulator family: Fungal Specific TF [Penicillium brevicompactum]